MDDTCPIKFDKDDNSEVKEPIYRSTGRNFYSNPEYSFIPSPNVKSNIQGHYYCILRVGKSFKTLGQVYGFEKHMERLQDTPNADPSVQNEIIIGGRNLSQQVAKYISDCRYNTDRTVIARELLLTASPDFFLTMKEEDLKLWVVKNIEYLNNRYDDNILYITLHKDEKSPHLHVLLSPKVWSEKRNCYVLSSRQLFGDREKLREIQTDYAKHMAQTFPCLNRGIMNSKAKHIEIKHFYGILNNVKSRENADIILKNDILIQSKLKGLNATLEAYRQTLEDKNASIEELHQRLLEVQKQVKSIKKDRDIYKTAVKQLSQQYKIPQNAVEKALKYAQEVNHER